MNDGLNLKIQASTNNAIKKLKSLSQSFNNLAQQSSKSGKDMKKFQKEIDNLNKKFTNLNKDANRASVSIGKMGSVFKGLNTAINVTKLYALGNAIANAVQSSLDMIETNNLFEVSLGNMSEQADETVQRLNEIYGLDTTNLRNSIGTYAMLARSMGMTSEQARTLSTSTTQLALELSSLTNVPINQVMADLRSGLLGQSETVYKYGMDVTEAGLKQEALRQGITKSVREMSQGEKMALRYSVMLRQSGIAHGDFAKTIESPSNQLKMLSERMTTLSRTIGSLFIPMLKLILPYANAVIQVLIDLGKTLASLMGAELPDISNKTGIGSINEDVDGLGDSFGDATKDAEKFKKAVMGFDNVNIIPDPTTSASGGGGVGSSILDGINLDGYDVANSPFNKVSELVKKFKDALDGLYKKTEPTRKALKKLWDEGLKPIGNFIWDTLKGFYKNFIVPVGEWAMSDDGIPKLVTALKNLLSKIDWTKLSSSLSKLSEALAPFVISVGTGLISFIEKMSEILAPIISTTIDAIATAIGGIASVIESFPEELGVGIGGVIGGIATALLLINGATKVGDIIKSLADYFPKLIAGIGSGGFIGTALTVIGAIAGLAIAMDEYKFNQSNLKPYFDAVDDVLESSEKMREESDKLVKNIQTEREEMLLHYDYIDELAKRYFALSEKTDLTNVEQLELIGYAKELVEHIPELAKKIDVQTGAYEGTKDEILKLIDTTKDYYILQAIQEDFIELTKQQWENQKELTKLEGERKTILEELEDRQSKFTTAIDGTNSGIRTYSEELRESDKNNANLRKEIEKLEKKLEDVDTKTSSLKDSQNLLNKEIKIGEDYIKEYAKTTETKFSGLGGILQTALEDMRTKISNFKLPSIMTSLSVDTSALNNIDLGGPRIQNVPKFATGGIVENPTLALVGEAGKEAVMPLEHNTGWIKNLAGQINELGGTGGVSENQIYNAMKRVVDETDSDTVIMIDSREVARANNKGVKKLNRSKVSVSLN